MDFDEKDDIPMIPSTDWRSDSQIYNDNRSSQIERSVSISIPVNSTESDSGSTSLVGFTGPLRSEKGTLVGFTGPLRRSRKIPEEPVKKEDIIINKHQWGDRDHNEIKNAHLMKSGKLGMCHDPYCTRCPTSYHHKGQPMTRVSHGFNDSPHAYGSAKGWVREKLALLKHFTFGVMNPHAKFVQQWNQFVVITCTFAIFTDPLFVYLLSVDKENKCIEINWPMTQTIVVCRSLMDLVYFMHMLVQFRLAFISPESRVVGAGDLVDQPRKIALHYLSGFFFLDLIIVLPLPQLLLLLLPSHDASFGANSAKNILRTAVLLQYIPRLCRFLPLLAGQSPSGFTFESAWANFVINLLTFALAGHVVGSFWYIFGLERVNQCLQDACYQSQIKNCHKFMDCGQGIDFGSFESDPTWKIWKHNEQSSACFNEREFPYGIYENAVNLTTQNNIITRYFFSFLWGFQQISTLAGNQNPSYNFWEVFFMIAIIGLGLLLFALLIGNMQNFLQGLERRRLEMSLRRRDVEQWMSHRNLPEDLKRKVRESERYNWAATRGVNEEMLMENLPEDLQRDIRRHLLKFVKKVRIFALMDEPILDAICERLRQKTYIKGGTPMYKGEFVTKMVFIVRGKMESIAEDKYKVPLSEGDVCGEELLSWCLENSSLNGDKRSQRKTGYRLISNRTVKCLTNVEAFVLQVADLEEVTTLFAGFLRNQRVQYAIKNESPYWRGLAATTIQVTWRYRKKQQMRARAKASSGTALPSKFHYQ